jgi:hypothetical protein
MLEHYQQLSPAQVHDLNIIVNRSGADKNSSSVISWKRIIIGEEIA